jgi:hypothetical protein
MSDLTRPYWPEPAAIRGKPDGTTVTLTGELAYAARHTSHQGNAYMTGVLRMWDSDGEIPIEVPPMVYARIGGSLVESETCTLTGRIDRRGPVHILTVMEAVVEPTDVLDDSPTWGPDDYETDDDTWADMETVTAFAEQGLL